MGNASPDQSIAGAISSILKKSGASSSGQGSLEDLTSGSDGIKSILKKRHALASNSASAASVGAANAGSTDDELEQEGGFFISYFWSWVLLLRSKQLECFGCEVEAKLEAKPETKLEVKLEAKPCIFLPSEPEVKSSRVPCLLLLAGQPRRFDLGLWRHQVDSQEKACFGLQLSLGGLGWRSKRWKHRWWTRTRRWVRYSLFLIMSFAFAVKIVRMFWSRGWSQIWGQTMQFSLIWTWCHQSQILAGQPQRFDLRLWRHQVDSQEKALFGLQLSLGGLSWRCK